MLEEPSSARGTGTALTLTLNQAFALLSSASHLLNVQDVSGKCLEVGENNYTNEWRLRKDISLPSSASQGISSASPPSRELCEQQEVLRARTPWLGLSCLARKRHSEGAVSQHKRAAVSIHSFQHPHSS